MNDGADGSLLPLQDLSNGQQSTRTNGLGRGPKTKPTQSRAHGTKNLIWPWIWLIIAISFLIITAIYAAQYPLASRVRFIYSSSSNTIFILSLLSGINGILLSITMSSTFELIQWTLLLRSNGMQLPTLLALQAGTGVFGYLTLIFSPRLPFWSSARTWSILRLICSVLVPILGILIMSQVNTQITFDTDRHQIPSQGWGMTPFNGSLAKNVSLVADQIIQAQLDTFLQDTSRAVDITPPDLRTVQCLSSPTLTRTVPCKRTYFMAGVEFTPSAMDNYTGLTNTQVILARNQQSYILDYEEQPGDEVFKDTDCQAYGFPFAGFNLCMRNDADNVLDAQIVQCPPEITAKLACFKDISWHKRPGWRTRLMTHFRPATVAYSRLNGSIVSWEFTSSVSKPAPVAARHMLQAYRDAYGNYTSLPAIEALLKDPTATDRFPIYAFPAIVAINLKGINTLRLQNPAVQNRAAANLQCLLAIMIYYAQPSLFAKYLAQTNATTDPLATFKKDILAIAPAGTSTTIAVPRYQITVGKATLTAYLVLSGLPLVICTAVLLLITISSIRKHVPDLSPFPQLDAAVRCREVGNMHQHAFADPRLEEVILTGSGRQLMTEASHIRLHALSLQR